MTQIFRVSGTEDLVSIADATIPKSFNKTVLIYKEGETQDIVREVLACYKDSKDQLDSFAPHLKGRTVLETCDNIWNFWKENIRYKIDAEGGQWVKTPSAVWSEKQCDCKSFAVAVICSLDSLGIAGKFRFVSFGTNKIAPTHVYAVAMHEGKEIIIDCVWNRFNSQKAFTKNWDHNMGQIFRVSGLDTEVQKGVLAIDVNDDSTTQAEMDLALNKQTLELEQMISRRKNAVGSITDDAYQTEIEAHNAALGAIGKAKAKAKAGPKAKATGKPAQKSKVVKLPGAPNKKTAKAIKANNGKGVTKAQAKKLQKAGVTIVKRKATLLKRVAKGITKTLSTPLRLAAKTQLPKNAPFFLYLFITDPKIIAALPDAVVLKRQKALNFKKVLVDKLQMKESNFTATVRNGIMNQLGKSPEATLALWMKAWTDKRLSAAEVFKNGVQVGVIPLVALKAAGSGLKALLSKLGANITEDVENFSPAPEDWGAVSDEVQEQLAKDVQAQPDNNDPTEGKGSVVPVNNEGDYVVKTMNNAPEPAPANYNTGSGYTPAPVEDGRKWENSTGNEGEPEGETDLANVKTEEGVVVTSSIKRPLPPEEKSDNTMLYLGAGVLAVLALNSK